MGNVQERTSSPVDEKGPAEVVKIRFSFPRKVAHVLPTDFVKYRDLTASATDDLIPRDAIDK